MNKLIKKSLLATGTALFTLSALTAFADQPLRGSFTGSVDSQEILPVNDKGHILRMAESSGLSTATTGPFLDGWNTVVKEINDLTQGSGPSRGHVLFSSGDDSAVVEWTGTTTTVMAEDGTPMTGTEGKWSYTDGSGDYSNLVGNGTFKQTFTSETTYVVTYEGWYRK